MKKLLVLLSLSFVIAAHAECYSEDDCGELIGNAEENFKALENSNNPGESEIYDKSEESQNPLFKAARGGQLDIVKSLVEKGADVNQMDNDGETPLFGAAKHGHLEIIKFLVSKGASGDQVNNYGITPLFRAVDAVNGEHLDIVKFLVDETGADVRRDLGGLSMQTPLHWAATNGHLDTIKFLVERGANVNSADYFGRSPLWMNIIFSHPSLDVVKFLVEKGADVNQKTYNGDTPIRFAKKVGGLREIAKYLRKHGGK